MIHDLHTCSELHVNLEFYCLLTIRIHPLSHFQLLNLLFLSILFVTHCLIFIYIDSIHPVWLGKNCQCRSSCGSLLPFSINPLCLRVHPCECGCIHEVTLLPYPAWWIQLFSGWTEHLWIAWLYFPGLKVGPIDLYSSSFLTVWWRWL
jgi:hypothetical protein